MGSRRKGREYALQTLYLTDLTSLEPHEALKRLISGQHLEEKIIQFAEILVAGTAANKSKVDELITRYTENWELGRMATLDRNILRLGAYEILFELKTPVSVIIDEAVEIAKTFSTPDSGKFVNGILDKIKGERLSQRAHTDGQDSHQEKR